MNGFFNIIISLTHGIQSFIKYVKKEYTEKVRIKVGKMTTYIFNEILIGSALKLP